MSQARAVQGKVMVKYQSTLRTKVYILLASTFDELFVVNCLCQMREERLAVSLVGLSAGLLNGLHGLIIKPDMSLTQLEQQSFTGICPTLVIPGGQACVMTLLADPRVHQLLATTLNAEGFVVAGAPVQEFLANIGTDSPGNRLNILVQDGLSPDDFIEYVIRRISI
jgi:hypothetical protein